MKNDIRYVPGRKFRNKYYLNMIKPYLNNEYKIYVEPFAGSFQISKKIDFKPDIMVYNDIYVYDGIETINADFIEHFDFQKCINKWDSEETFFYLDPPYYDKEHLYNLKRKDEHLHIKLRDVLLKIKGDFIINYEKCDFIMNLYNDEYFNIYDYGGIDNKDITITKNN